MVKSGSSAMPFSSMLFALFLLFLGGCASILNNDSSDYSTTFLGYVKSVKTVYKTGSSSTNRGVAGAIIGGIAGAGLTRGSAAGTIIGAGTGAIIGSSTGNRNTGFSEKGTGDPMTKVVIVKDNGDRITVVQRYTRDLMRGDRVKVSVHKNGNVAIQRVRVSSDQPHHPSPRTTT